ncbi:MAG: hypothetical protein Q4G50_03395 [Corynebacterium sp.]|uniref:hypothetical protein n=1 Tax=Corynebacterium sp. TaxID=1720 RepID=UPI0026E06762|nr:hypothetical protein [Corynebacterium sp.]MDO5669028.1 hypothetical protein [Corynebacterium sp.]
MIPRRLLVIACTAVTLSACATAEPAPEPPVTVTEAAPTTEIVVTDSVPVAPDGLVDVTELTLIGNGDAIFLTPDSQGICWLYGPEKDGLGLCTVSLADPPIIDTVAGPTAEANAIAFDEGGIFWAHNFATGHAPPNSYVLQEGEFVEFRDVRCEALSANELECTHAGDTVTYVEGTVTPEPRRR